MDGIKPHCMGTAFPTFEEQIAYKKILALAANLPTAADLDAVAEEQRVKEETGKTK